MAKPESTPDDTTEGEEFAAFADEARDWADVTLPTALEGWPDDTAPPVTAEGMRERCLTIARDAGMAYDRAAKTFDWDGYNAALVDAIVAALAADPGDLPARMAEAAKRAFAGRPPAADGTLMLPSDRNPWRALDDALAAAMSVCWEDQAATLARLAQAEARAEYAESQLSSRDDHHTHWEAEKARADKAEERLAAARTRMHDLAVDIHAAEERKAEVERLRAENGLLRIRAAGADTRNDLLHADLAEARKRQLASDETVAVRAYQQVKAQRDRALAEVERLRAELADEEYQKNRWIGDAAAWERRAETAEAERDDQKRRGDQYFAEAEHWAGRVVDLEAERDLLRETLAESDLGAQVLAQWEAIAAADADRDRLGAEVERLSVQLDNVRWHLGTRTDERDDLRARLTGVAIHAERLKTWTEDERASVTVAGSIVADLLAAVGAKSMVETAGLVAERDALIDEVKTLQADLEEFGEAQKAWVQFRRERDALKAARCPSCDHLTSHHQPEGCWYGITTSAPGRDLVCPCIVPLAALAVPESTRGTDATGETGETHKDAHGRSWDPHPFVKSSRVGDNVAICVCGQSPEHQIHAPKGGED